MFWISTNFIIRLNFKKLLVNKKFVLWAQFFNKSPKPIIFTFRRVKGHRRRFHKQGEVSNTNQNSSWKPDSEGKFSRVFRIFSAIGRNPTRGVSWSRVARFSILDFSIGFQFFFKFSPKMLYLGPIYPRKVGHIDTS
jgi:hypothetical protein